LPGAGKTTLAKALAKIIKATYLRVDSIERRIEASSLEVNSAEDAGYLVAYRMAEDNLLNGQIVIADSVNSIELTRRAWRGVAESVGCSFIELVVSCSNSEERCVRLEIREANKVHNVDRLMNREFESWTRADSVIDTAGARVEDSLAEILALLK
jgi:predicted kinase